LGKAQDKAHLQMIGITIICVGRMKERYYSDAANEYIKRLSGYCNTEIIELREHRLPDAPSDVQIALALKKESAAIADKRPGAVPAFALCVEGREMDSRELAGMLDRYAGRGASRLCFIIGGSYGLHENVKNTVDIKLSLSKMTFPHNLARIILLEQLYRSFKIAEGGKYHK
jgi:23S rRNA (pseudouridine1915-N3)-methyltransferase